MTNNFIGLLITSTLLEVLGFAGDPHARPIVASRDTRPFPAVDAAGRTYVTERELNVELEQPDGKKSIGRLGIILDPATGFFLHQLSLYHEPVPWKDYLSSTAHIGLGADRLVLVMFGNGIGIVESTEKAENIDEAEAKALKWIEGHFDKPDTRSYRTESIGVTRWDLPKGFFRSEYDSRLALPVKIVDMQARDHGWDLVLQSADANATPQMATVYIFRQGNMWVRNEVKLYESPKAP
jgi:hypothetical protein